MTDNGLPMRAWRDVPLATPAASQLQLLATPHRLLIQSPSCRPPAWLHTALLCAAQAVTLFAIFVWPDADDPGASSPFLPAPVLLCILLFVSIQGWLLLWQSQRFLVLELTRDTWHVRRVRPMLGGLAWKHSSNSGDVVGLDGAEVVTAVVDDGYECGVKLLCKDGDRVVYSNADRNPLFSLSLTDVDFVAAHINHFLDAGEDVSKDGSEGVLGGVTGSSGNVYAGGAPFARPAALVPSVPPAGQGFITSDTGDELTIVFPQPFCRMLQVFSWLSIALVFALLAIRSAWQRDDAWWWHTYVTILLLLSAWRAHYSAKQQDTLTLTASDWRLVQQRREYSPTLKWTNTMPAHVPTDEAHVEGTWAGIVGAKVISTVTSHNTHVSCAPNAHGGVAISRQNGQLEMLPIGVARILTLPALEFLASAINAYLARTVHPNQAAGCIRAVVENEAHLSPIADLLVAPSCAVHSRCAQQPNADLPTSRERVAAGKALAERQAEVLAEASSGSSAALMWLEALEPVVGRRVSADTSKCPDSLHVRVVPDWALRRAAVTAFVVIVLASFAAFVGGLIAVVGCDDSSPLVLPLTFCLAGLCGIFLSPAATWAVGVPWTADIKLSAREWSLQQRMNAPRWALPLRLCAYTRSGATADLLAVEVLSDAKMPASTKLQLRTTSCTHTISAVPCRGLSLREKVSVMRHVAVFMAAHSDGGERGIVGASVNAPLLC